MTQTHNDPLDEDFCEITDDFGCPAYEAFCNTRNDDDFRWIRLEKTVDPVLQNITTPAQVLLQMQAVQTEFDQLGNADIYPQTIEYINKATSGRNNKPTIKVLQFNTLAEGLSAGPHVPRPFEMHTGNDRNNLDDALNYGGFTEIPFPEKILDFSKRRWRLLQIMIGSQGNAHYDIIAIEELDRFRGFFLPILRMFGYEGIFAPKSRSPGVRMGWYSDGCALFFKSDVFELETKHRLEYKIGSQGCIIAKLKHKVSEKNICVGVTHLKASKNETNELIRYRQVEELKQYIRDVTAENDEDIPVLIMGDFNADPPGFCAGDKSSIALMLNDTHGEKAFQSVYAVNPPAESFYTTWKSRGITTTKRIIDYIFYRGNISMLGKLSVPYELEETKLPGLRYPSDHIAIGAEFKLD